MLEIKKIKFQKNVAVILLAATLFLSSGLPAIAAVPTFDVGLNPKMDILLSMIAGIYQKEVGEPPYPPPSVFTGIPSLSSLASSLYNIAQCPIAASGGIIGAILGFITGSVSLDCLTWVIGKEGLHEFSQDVVDWIQGNNASQRFFDFTTGSFFSGNPLAVTDWEQFLFNAADTASGYFLNELGLTNLCDPFGYGLTVKQAISGGLPGTVHHRAPFAQRANCTVTALSGNLQSMFTNFGAAGGWTTWNQVVAAPQNNPFGQYMMSMEEKALREALGTQKNLLEAETSEGFLGEQRCNPIFSTLGVGLGPVGEDCDIITPGKVMVEILRDNIGSEVDTYVNADELDELIFSFFKNFIDSLLFGSSGLLGTNTATFNVPPVGPAPIPPQPPPQPPPPPPPPPSTTTPPIIPPLPPAPPIIP